MPLNAESSSSTISNVTVCIAMPTSPGYLGENSARDTCGIVCAQTRATGSLLDSIAVYRTFRFINSTPFTSHLRLGGEMTVSCNPLERLFFAWSRRQTHGVEANRRNQAACVVAGGRQAAICRAEDTHERIGVRF
jgi:hypothetical protein